MLKIKEYFGTPGILWSCVWSYLIRRICIQLAFILPLLRPPPSPHSLAAPLSTFPLSLTTSPSPTIQPQLSNSPPSFSTLLPSYQTGQFFLRFTHFSLTSKCSEERLVLSEGYLAAIERSNYSVGNVSRQKKCLTGLLVVSWILLLLVSAYTWVSILHLTQYLGV